MGFSEKSGEIVVRSWLASEDWLAVWLGVIVIGLALPAAAGCDLLGWIFTPQVWLNATSAARPVSKAYAGLPGAASLLSTYLFLLVLVGLGAAAQHYDLHAFLPGFTAIFWISVACWLLSVSRAGCWAIMPISHRRRTSE
jgi:hypothetical protein